MLVSLGSHGLFRLLFDRPGFVGSKEAAKLKAEVAFEFLQFIRCCHGAGVRPEGANSAELVRRSKLRADIPLVELECNINDAAFAGRAVETLLELRSGQGRSVERSAS